MFPFQNNHSPLNLLYMYTTIKQNILYNKRKHCYTDRPFLLNKRSSMLDETFMFYTSHQACISQHRISKTLHLCSLLPICMVAMAVKWCVLCSTIFGWNSYNDSQSFFFLMYKETFVSSSEWYSFSIILCTIYRRTLIWHPQDWTGTRLSNIPVYQTVPSGLG